MGDLEKLTILILLLANKRCKVNHLKGLWGYPNSMHVVFPKERQTIVCSAADTLVYVHPSHKFPPHVIKQNSRSGCPPLHSSFNFVPMAIPRSPGRRRLPVAASGRAYLARSGPPQTPSAPSNAIGLTAMCFFVRQYVPKLPAEGKIDRSLDHELATE